MASIGAVVSVAFGQLRVRPATFAGLAAAILLTISALTCFGTVIATGVSGPPASEDQPGLVLVGGAFGEIVIVISVILTVNTLAFSTRQQHRELALMRLLAASPRQIMRVLRWEVALVTLIVCAPSWILGFVSARWLIDSLVGRGLAPAGSEVGSPVIPMATAAVVTLAIGTACSTVTGRSIVSGAPIKSLNAAVSGRGVRRWLRNLAGLAVLGGGVMFCLFITGQPPDKAADGALVAALILLVATMLLGPVLTRRLAATLAMPVRIAMPRSGWLAVMTLRGQSERLAAAVVPIAMLTGLSGTFEFISAAATAAAPTDGTLATVASSDDQWLRSVEITIFAAFGSVAVVNTLIALTVARRDEFDLLQRIGATRRQVLIMLLLEAVLIAVVAIGAGTAIAVGTATAFVSTLPAMSLPGIPANYALLAVGSMALTVTTIGATGWQVLSRGNGRLGYAGGSKILAIVTAVVLCGTSVDSEASAFPTTPDGIWKVRGYSTVLTVRGERMNSYETTTSTCISGSFSAVAVPHMPGQFASPDDGTRSTLRVGRNSGTWDIDANTGTRQLTRLPHLPAGCLDQPAADPISTFDLFWSTMSENYPFFARHHVDWNQSYIKFRPLVHSKTSPRRLSAIFSDMIEPLHDAHVMIVPNDGPPIAFQRPGTQVPSTQLDGRYRKMVEELDIGHPLTAQANGRIQYSDLPDNLGYLRITGFGGYSEDDTFAENSRILDNTLDSFFTPERVNRLRGLVIDLRVNGGGDDPLALALASRFTRHSYTGYRKVSRDSATNPLATTKPEPIIVNPSLNRPLYTGPLAILVTGSTVSAGEVATQVLRERHPRPIVIGENSQGVFSDTLDRSLPNGWALSLPTEQYLNAQGSTFDVTGIPPDIRTPELSQAEPSSTDRDYGFNAAMEYFQQATKH